MSLTAEDVRRAAMKACILALAETTGAEVTEDAESGSLTLTGTVDQIGGILREYASR